MATERRMEAIPSQLVLSDGDNTGRLSVTDASIFKVKQLVSLFSDDMSPIKFQVKLVIPGYIYLGRPDKPITEYSDLTDYTLADSTRVSAEEQPRPTIPQEDYERAAYEEEPVVAKRTILVDKYGRKIDENNPLPISESGGITPAIFDRVVILRDIEDDPIRYDFYLNGSQVGAVDVLYYDSKSTAEYVKGTY